MILTASVRIPSRMKAARAVTALALAALVAAGFPRRLAAAASDDAASDDAASDDAASDDAASDDAASVARVAKAEAAFEEGRALLQQGRLSEACSKLEQSQQLDPGLGTQLNLADCYERSGRFASAHALFVEVAAAARALGQQRREEVARTRAAALEAKVSQLVVIVPAGAGPELRVERDGRALQPGEWNVLTPVDPGLHRVRAAGPGVGEWSTELRVGNEGALHEVAVPFDDARPFLAPLHRKLGLAAAGVGVAGVIAGSVFGLRAMAKKDAAERAGCDGRTCDTAESGALRDEARRAGEAATWTMSAGAVGLAAAAVLLWVVPEPGPESMDGNERSVSLEVGPHVEARGGGLWLHARF
jgi:hypothetical protein